ACVDGRLAVSLVMSVFMALQRHGYARHHRRCVSRLPEVRLFARTAYGQSTGVLTGEAFPPLGGNAFCGRSE
ncbi:MAG TPA: hypothetical protein VK459_28735, partial [Polyangiaceae bacterium]|nr:hypothetical protein [Polyangiaceae bacterium]